MGVDYYECDSCTLGFRDDSDYCAYCQCGCKFCSVKCGNLDNYREEYEETEDNEFYQGDPIDPNKPITCVICRKEKHTVYGLLQALLTHFNITEEDAIKIWKNED